MAQGEGVLITEVIEGTPAEKADLKAGDVIISVNGARVASVSDLSRELEDDVVELEIVREQRVQTVTADLKKKEREREGYNHLFSGLIFERISTRFSQR